MLDGTAATEEALCRVAGGRLTLLSAGSHEDRPPGGSPDKLRALFHALRSRYDLVLADAGPLWSFGKPPEILAVCDGALWVRSRDATSREELSAASAALSERGIAVLGVVENFVPRPGGRRAGAGRPHV